MLDAVDLTQTLDRKQFEKQRARLQKQLGRLGHQIFTAERLVVIVFEGPDGAGKGGAIRSVTRRLDPRGYQVYVTNPPTGEEADHHDLWRFWRRLPEAGRIAIFDRSWYRRVIMGRASGDCRQGDCKRAYREINQFERQLADFGALLFKFWIQISEAEQKRRLAANTLTPHLHWRTPQDTLPLGERWPAFQQAANEMLFHTNTTVAPWTVIPGDSKRYARLQILNTLAETLQVEFGPDEGPKDKDKKAARKAKKPAKLAGKKKNG